MIPYERERVFTLISAEREVQHKLHGNASDVRSSNGRFIQKHGNFGWSSILLEEAGEAAQEVNKGNDERLFSEVIQVAAVAVAWLEHMILVSEGGSSRGKTTSNPV